MSPLYMLHIHHSRQTDNHLLLLLPYMILKHLLFLDSYTYNYPYRENPAKVSLVTSCLIPPTM